MSEDVPKDVSSIAFPSDAITLGQMRKQEPGLFTDNALQSTKLLDCDAVATHWWERVLAENAIARAAGRSLPHPDVDRTHVVNDLLHEAYEMYGLSKGIHETGQMVQRFEQDAVRQVKPDRLR